MLRRGLGLPCFNLPGLVVIIRPCPCRQVHGSPSPRPKSPCPGLSDITKNKNISVFQSCQSSISEIFFQGLR